MPSRKKLSLPEEGEAFVFPLVGERYGICRVLRKANANDMRELGENAVLVACSAWIGTAIPAPDDPSLRAILHVTHHSWKGQANIFWTNDSPPSTFQSLGVILPTHDEQTMSCDTFAGWQSCPFQLCAQWRWDNERESVLAEDSIDQATAAAKLQALEQERESELQALTLEVLKKHKFFGNWKDFPSKEAIRACRAIMKNTVSSLSELGMDSNEDLRLQILQSCIEDLNRLDDAMGNFIQTDEREDICTEFEMIVHACGLGHKGNLVDEWRNW